METQEPFKISLRGFDRDEVLVYLQDLSRRHELELQNSQAEIARLKEQNQNLARQLHSASPNGSAVQSVMRQAEARLESQKQQTEALAQEVARLRQELQVRENQKDAVSALLNETRTRCNKIIDDATAHGDAILHQAEQRSDIIIKEAEKRASVILQRSQEDADKIQASLLERCDTMKQTVSAAVQLLTHASEYCSSAISISEDPYGFLCDLQSSTSSPAPEPASVPAQR